jgi:hypothetical protein
MNHTSEYLKSCFTGKNLIKDLRRLYYVILFTYLICYTHLTLPHNIIIRFIMLLLMMYCVWKIVDIIDFYIENNS